jgi:thioesterase domain-containing protein
MGGDPEELQAHAATWASRVELAERALRGDETDELWTELEKVHNELFPDLEMDRATLPRRLRLFGITFSAVAGYAPDPYEGATVVLQADDWSVEIAAAAREAWSPLLRGLLAFRTVHGVHRELLSPPAVETVAGVIRSAIESGPGD